jgi:dolichyl-phosphate beta-glucosyltransferase
LIVKPDSCHLVQVRTPAISLIIPAYNEGKRLPATLEKIMAFLQSEGAEAEILIVDDGSIDNTAQVAREFSSRYPSIFLISTPHRGKGHAVKSGMLKARGDMLLLVDADLSVPIDHVWKLLVSSDREDVIAIGSREAPGAERLQEPPYRHALGVLYNVLLRHLLNLSVKDTQCGFKCFHNRIAKKLFSLQTLNGWAFDVEILYLASRMGCGIIEVPVIWQYDSDTRIKVARDSCAMLRDLFFIKWNDLKGRYRTAGSEIRQS